MEDSEQEETEKCGACETERNEGAGWDNVEGE